MKKISLKLNTDLNGKKAGDVITVEIDANKVITDRYWRRRLADASIDNCVEVVKQETKSKGDNKS
jgi:hypothetical protein